MIARPYPFPFDYKLFGFRLTGAKVWTVPGRPRSPFKDAPGSQPNLSGTEICHSFILHWCGGQLMYSFLLLLLSSSCSLLPGVVLLPRDSRCKVLVFLFAIICAFHITYLYAISLCYRKVNLGFLLRFAAPSLSSLQVLVAGAGADAAMLVTVGTRIKPKIIVSSHGSPYAQYGMYYQLSLHCLVT